MGAPNGPGWSFSGSLQAPGPSGVRPFVLQNSVTPGVGLNRGQVTSVLLQFTLLACPLPMVMGGWSSDLTWLFSQRLSPRPSGPG